MRALMFASTLAVTLLTSGANAASLTVSTDRSVYDFGDLVTLTVTGTSNGSTETDTAVFARLNFSPGLAFVSSTQVTGSSFGGALPWTPGALANGPGFAVAINQIANLSPVPAFQDASGTVVLQITGLGEHVIAFDAPTADYFGATPGGPAIFTILAVPEPSTAALLALGLLGLGAARQKMYPD